MFSPVCTMCPVAICSLYNWCMPWKIHLVFIALKQNIDIDGLRYITISLWQIVMYWKFMHLWLECSEVLKVQVFLKLLYGWIELTEFEMFKDC